MSKKIRKLLLGVLSLAMLIPSFNISVKAEGETLVTMDGILEYYQTVKGKVETNEEIDTISYKWMYSDTETGTYTEIAKSDYVTDNSITIVQGANKITDNPNMSGTMLLYGLNQPYAGKWLKYVVTINGEDYESAPGKIGDSWADAGLYKAAAADETYAANSPSENLFTADGQEFILLDDTASSASRYFVLAKNQYGTLPANTGSSQQTEKWAVYLNTEFKDSKQLPESILNDINYEQYCKVAPRYYGRSNDNLWNPAVKAGIFFLGNQEYLKYHEKIGYADGSSANWWLRDPAIGITNDGNGIMKVNASDGSTSWGNSKTEALGLRPAFYLNEDFFKNVKITNAGENVMKKVLEDYTEEELTALYGPSYRSQMSGTDAEPIVPIMEGIFEYYNTINGSVIENDIYDEYDMTTAAYSWLYSDTENGTYSEIPKSEYVTDTSITLVQGSTVKENPNMAGSILLEQLAATYTGKYLKYAVTVGGKTFTSEPQKIGDAWYERNLYGTNTVDDTYVEEAPKENVFVAGGQEFILLDTTMSDASHYFVLAKEQYLNSKEGSGQRMESWAMWMDDTFKNGGYLPDDIINNINYAHYWKVARPYYNGNLWNPAVKAGIFFLGNQEYLKYHEKIGYADGGTASWWLRDPAIGITNDGNCIMIVKGTDGSTNSANRTKTDCGIRPAFYLNKDFFKKVKVSDAGANVLAQIQKDVTKEELISLYGEDYLTDMGETKHNIYLKGIFETDEIINAASETIELANAEYKWMVSDKKLMNYTELEGADSSSFIIPQELAGKYLKAVVTVDGKTYESKPEKIGALWNVRQSNSAIASVKQHAPAEYVFSVDGQQYVLLDTTASDSSKYLIMSKNNAANKKFTENGSQSQIFGLGENNIGSWLNNDYFYSFSEEMRESINTEQSWKIDIPMWTGDTELKLTAGVVLPGVNEIKKYKGKIGFDEDMGYGWWTRTPLGVRGGDGNHIMKVTYEDGNAELISTHSTEYAGIRPMFYADKDFFNKVKVTGAGSEVLKYIEKSSLYTDDEWTALHAQSKESIVFNIPTEYLSTENTAVSVDFDIERNTSAVYTIEHICNGTNGIPTTLTYNGKINENVPVGMDDIPNGVNTVTVTVKRDNNVIAECTKEVTAYTPFSGNVNQASTLNGYCAFVGGRGSNLLKKANDAGTQINRIALAWSQIEDGADGRGKGEYDWNEMDSVMLPLFESGIEPLVLLCYNNSLYDNSTYTLNGKTYRGLFTKECIDAFAAYAKAIAQHYLDMGYKIKYFEFWNEPNAGKFFPNSLGHKFYSDAMAVAANEIKEVLPDAVMIGGAIAHTDSAWMSSMVNTGYYAADGFSYHPYVSSASSKTDIDNSGILDSMVDMSNVALSYGGWKESWITEFGASTWTNADYGFTEEEQARELVKEAVISNAAYSDANIYYCFRNTGNKPDEYEQNFGSVENNGNIKPAYIAAASMMDNLAGAIYLGCIDGTVLGLSAAKMYVYARDGEIIGVVWNTVDSKANVNFGNESLTVCDIYNNTAGENLSNITVDKSPVYIHGLSIKWANDALSAAITDRVGNNSDVIGVSEDIFRKAIEIAGEFSASSEVLNTDEYIETVHSISKEIIDSTEYSEKEKSSLLYTVHQITVMLAGYGTLNRTAETVLTAPDRYSAVSETVSAKEAKTYGGKQIYADSMLNIANKYIGFAEDVSASELQSEYKYAIMKAYDTIANKAITDAENFSAAETVTNSSLLVQVPLLEANLETLAAGYAKSGTLNVSVYNYGMLALEDVTVELQNASGDKFSSDTVTFSCESGADTVVSIPYKAVRFDKLKSSSNGYNYYADVVIKSGDTEISRTTAALNRDGRDGLFTK